MAVKTIALNIPFYAIFVAMRIRTLNGIDPTLVMEAFNKGFSDYSVPVQMTAEQWAYKMRSENVQWNLSVGAFDEDQLVGFILHGNKTRNGQQWVYNGGTAVIPSHRGQRLTQKMYDYILPILREQSVSKILLEVIDTNEPAITTYQAIGFKNTRRLLCFKGHYQAKILSNNYEIRTLATLDWAVLKTFGEVTPSWQNDIEAVELIRPQIKALGIFRDNILVGYLIYNPVSNKIFQLAIAKEQRQKGLASALLQYAFGETDKPLILTNIEDTATVTINCLNHFGLEHFITQNEMALVMA
ncbi:GNAT family N-acetyltransferase [Flavobacterium terrisoli]|uniref:GNAT family N-acetyltransferase n=1 Tax=Flavobacterium terrisoli TaxID=3242195 RepID=UPI002543B1D9|nr:GNAT family N-acetyltransferase [Flavobacterium buctense]